MSNEHASRCVVEQFSVARSAPHTAVDVLAASFESDVASLEALYAALVNEGRPRAALDLLNGMLAGKAVAVDALRERRRRGVARCVRRDLDAPPL